jgi:hypothetical protein
MVYPIKSIIKVLDYPLPQGPNIKYFVVIDCAKDKEFTLLSMTTTNKRQFYFDLSAISITHGPIRNSRGEVFLYCFKAGKVIGQKGFSFPEHTFLLAETSFRTHTCEQMYGFEVEYMDELLDDEFNDLLYSFVRSPLTKIKYLQQIEEVLAENMSEK